jgi:mycothiol synthase
VAGTLRELREQDAGEVVGLYRSAFGDARRMDEREILSWARNEELRPEWLRVLEVGGRVVGYGDIWIEDDEVALEVAAPGHWRTFLEWAEAAGRAEEVSRVRVLSYAGHELANVAAGRGYRLWRSAYTLQLEFGDRPPEATLPPQNVKLRSFGPEDTEALRAALNDVFAADPFFHQVTPSGFHEFYLRARGTDSSLWLLAWDSAELAGFILPVPERPGEAGLGQIRSLGVRAAWRGRGLGQALLRAAFRELHSRGCRRVELGVDAENPTGALRLYERVGMHIARQADSWALDL